MNRSAFHASGIAAALALLVAASAAGAATKGGITMPDTMQVGGTTLQLNGIGVRSFTILQIRGYVAALYLPTRTTDAETALSEHNPRALFMEFVRGAPKAKVHDLYVESSRKYCVAHRCTTGDQAAFQALLNTVRDVKPGDRTGFIVTDSGVQVMFNDVQVANIPDPAFGRIILDSDLGSTPPSAELRDGLLGKSG